MPLFRHNPSLPLTRTPISDIGGVPGGLAGVVEVPLEVTIEWIRTPAMRAEGADPFQSLPLSTPTQAMQGGGVKFQAILTPLKGDGPSRSPTTPATPGPPLVISHGCSVQHVLSVIGAPDQVNWESGRERERERAMPRHAPACPARPGMPGTPRHAPAHPSVLSKEVAVCLCVYA